MMGECRSVTHGMMLCAPCPPPMLDVDEFLTFAEYQNLTIDDIDIIVEKCNLPPSVPPTRMSPSVQTAGCGDICIWTVVGLSVTLVVAIIITIVFILYRKKKIYPGRRGRDKTLSTKRLCSNENGESDTPDAHAHNNPFFPRTSNGHTKDTCMSRRNTTDTTDGVLKHQDDELMDTQIGGVNCEIQQNRTSQDDWEKPMNEIDTKLHVSIEESTDTIDLNEKRSSSLISTDIDETDQNKLNSDAEKNEVGPVPDEWAYTEQL